MSNQMEPLVLDADFVPTEEIFAETPLDESTEWIGVINRKRETEKQQAEEARQRAIKDREESLKRKAAYAEEEARQYAEMLAVAAQKKHRNKIILCLAGIVLMLLMSGGSFVLQYMGFVRFPWSLVITGVFCAVAAFFAGVVWESCRK